MVAIVHHRGEEDLRDCLACLERQTLRPRHTVVVDNSEAGLGADFIAWARGVEILREGRNLGFAGGNNLALGRSDAEFFATINPDAFPEPGWLAAMVDAARRHPQAAAFGSLQILHRNPALADGLGDEYHVGGLAWRRGHQRKLAGLDLLEAPIFSPCGAAAFYRRAALESVGGFDADFFCYCEDLDAGFRLRLAGWECRFVPGAVVRHCGGGSTGGGPSDFADYHGHRNLLWLYVKNMPATLFWIFLPLHMAFHLALVFLLWQRGRGLLAINAKADALRGLPRMWKKRRSIQAQRKAPVSAIWRALEKSLLPEPLTRRPSDLAPEQ